MPIDKPYAYHKPSADGLAAITKLRAHFSEGDRLLREICPQSRQLSVALTNKFLHGSTTLINRQGLKDPKLAGMLSELLPPTRQ